MGSGSVSIVALWKFVGCGACCCAGTKLFYFVNYSNKAEGSHEKTHDDIYGSGARAGNDGHDGQRSNPGAGCCVLPRTADERDADCQTGRLSGIHWSLWLWPGLDQFVPWRLLPVCSLLVSGRIEEPRNERMRGRFRAASFLRSNGIWHLSNSTTSK